MTYHEIKNNYYIELDKFIEGIEHIDKESDNLEESEVIVFLIAITLSMPTK
jgi:hypothetical protein